MGGYDGSSGNYLSSVEIFPLPNGTCSIPDLPRPKSSPSLSLLPGRRLVVCGGNPTSEEKSCAVWTGGSSSTCTTRGHPILSFMLIKNSLNSIARRNHVQWTPPSFPDSIVMLGGRDDAAQLTAEIVPGFEEWSSFVFLVAGGGTFELRHSGYDACGIPDGDTIVMTGGKIHNHVERWQPTSSPSLSYKNTSIKFLFLCTNRLDCNKFYFMAPPSPICMETSASALILSQVQCKWLCRGTSPTARKQTKTRLRCPSFHQGETCQTNESAFPGIHRCWG